MSFICKIRNGDLLNLQYARHYVSFHMASSMETCNTDLILFYRKETEAQRGERTSPWIIEVWYKPGLSLQVASCVPSTSPHCLPELAWGSREMMGMTGTHSEKKTSLIKTSIHILMGLLFKLILTAAVITIKVLSHSLNPKSPRPGSPMPRGCYWPAQPWSNPNTFEKKNCITWGKKDELAWSTQFGHIVVTLGVSN